MSDTRPRRAGAFPRNVVVLGFVSLLNDISSEMIIPLLPAFLTGVLGAGALALGWIEGVADATASVLKLVSGRLSDRFGRRRPLVLSGYSLSSTVRPLIALATRPWHVLALRTTDRVGKGVRTSPRDALIAGSVAPERRGAAFGFHRAMDHAGAVIGPLIAAAYLMWLSHNLRPLFWLAGIPAIAAVIVLFVGVRELAPARAPATPPPPSPSAAAAPASPPPSAAAAEADPPPRGSLTRLLIPLGLFTLGNASDVFLLLKAGAVRAPLATLPLLWMGLHVVKSTTSVPGGRLADRWGRRRTIAVGWLVYAAIYVGFAFATTEVAVAALFVAYGLYHGLTEGAERALVSELVPKASWGGGFGWYYLTLGMLTLVASVVFGVLWSTLGAPIAFLTSACLAVAAVACLALLAPRAVR